MVLCGGQLECGQIQGHLCCVAQTRYLIHSSLHQWQPQHFTENLILTCGGGVDSRSVQLGGDAYAPSRKCLGLDLVSGSWRPRAPLTYEGRGRDTQLVRVGDTVLAVGGTKNGNTEAATIETYDAAADSWTPQHQWNR